MCNSEMHKKESTNSKSRTINWNKIQNWKQERTFY